MARQSERDSFIELRRQYMNRMIEIERTGIDMNHLLRVVPWTFIKHNNLLNTLETLRRNKDKSEEEVTEIIKKNRHDMDSRREDASHYIPTEDDYLTVLAVYNPQGRIRPSSIENVNILPEELAGINSLRCQKTDAFTRRIYGLELHSYDSTTEGDFGKIIPVQRNYMTDKDGRRIEGGDIYSYLAMRIKEDPKFEIHPDIVEINQRYNRIYQAFVCEDMALEAVKPMWLLGRAHFINILQGPELERVVPWITGSREIPHIKGIRSYT